MAYSSVVISAGHSSHVRGAAGPKPWGLDEVDEARKVMDRVASELRSRGVTVKTYADTISKTQSENLNRIVDYHNGQKRDVDVSVHFNAYNVTAKPMGCEVLYLTQKDLAAHLSKAIASNGFTNRGAKVRSDLFFLNHTAMPAVLLEICFVDSEADCAVYRDKFDHICASIANVIGGSSYETVPPSAEGPPVPPLLEQALFTTTGKCSWFGGPNDLTGVSASEGLAFFSSVTNENQHLFLPNQPANSTGLARRLNPWVHYIACRWNYQTTPKAMLAACEDVALVRATKTGREMTAFPADWGPNEKTGRVADLSESLMEDLGITTDDEVTVIFPYREDVA